MNDVIGFIRVNLPRYTASGQIKAMAAHSIPNVIRKGGKHRDATVPEGMKVVEGDIDTLLRMAAPGRLVAVQHAHLLANPDKRGVKGGTRQDFRRIWDALHAKGAVIWELYTNRRTDRGADREAIAFDAVEALALGRHKTRASDKRGRPAKTFSPKAWEVGKSRWDSRHIKTWAQVEKGLVEGMKARDLWEEYGPRNDDETEPD